MAHHAGVVGALPVFLLVLIVAFAFLALPLSPTLKATFKITRQNSYTAPKIELADATYNKVSLLASTSATKGSITVSYLGATQGSYSLTIVIAYGGNVLSSGSYSSLGDGLYQMYVAYLPRFGEQASTPYFVTFNLFYSDGTPATNLTITIYPT